MKRFDLAVDFDLRLDPDGDILLTVDADYTSACPGSRDCPPTPALYEPFTAIVLRDDENVFGVGRDVVEEFVEANPEVVTLLAEVEDANAEAAREASYESQFDNAPDGVKVALMRRLR